MAKINNAQVIQKLIDELQLYPGTDLIPTELAEKILPVFQINTQDVNVNVEGNFVKFTNAVQNSNDKSILVPTGKQWILKRVYIRYIADANAGNRVAALQIKDSAGEVIFQNMANIVMRAASGTAEVEYIDGSGSDFPLADGGVAQNGGTTPAQYYYLPKDIILLEGSIVRFFDLTDVSTNDDFTFNIIVDEKDV